MARVYFGNKTGKEAPGGNADALRCEPVGQNDRIGGQHNKSNGNPEISFFPTLLCLAFLAAIITAGPASHHAWSILRKSLFAVVAHPAN